MKILVVGDWHSELHEVVVFAAFEHLGHEVSKFSWHEYFDRATFSNPLVAKWGKAQNKYSFGPIVARLNNDLVEQAVATKPDMIFIYRGSHIYAKTLERIRQSHPETKILGYNNDDPFSPRYPWWMWRHFLRCVPAYDLVLAYRKHNIAEYLAAGARRVELLRSWFVPERNFPTTLSKSDAERFESDVTFVGHFEDDGRLECLEEVVRRGHKLRIFGPGYEWDDVLRNSALLADQVPVDLVWGQDYNHALCGAKLALCFFSQINRDTYTRRCFEIPASGTLLLSKYTDDVASMFQSGTEAVFFNDVEQLGSALDSLLADDVTRKTIAKFGTERVWADGHDVLSRMQSVLDWVNETPGVNH